ncbi:MAG TPA: hypothetical protein VN736_18445 [Candidatus Limnocylindrales bacterium]|nr:hypothetical protein [Candidatus Limnocylindrales bacterium]
MEYFDGLSRESHNDRELAGDLANGYLQLANVQGVPAYPNLRQFADAEASLAKAERFSEVAVKATPANTDAIFTSAEIAQFRMMLADSQRRDADVLKYAGDTGHRLECLVQHSAKQPDRIPRSTPNLSRSKASTTSQPVTRTGCRAALPSLAILMKCFRGCCAPPSRSAISRI